MIQRAQLEIGRSCRSRSTAQGAGNCTPCAGVVGSEDTRPALQAACLCKTCFKLSQTKTSARHTHKSKHLACTVQSETRRPCAGNSACLDKCAASCSPASPHMDASDYRKRTRLPTPTFAVGCPARSRTKAEACTPQAVHQTNCLEAAPVSGLDSPFELRPTPFRIVTRPTVTFFRASKFLPFGG